VFLESTFIVILVHINTCFVLTQDSIAADSNSRQH